MTGASTTLALATSTKSEVFINGIKVSEDGTIKLRHRFQILPHINCRGPEITVGNRCSSNVLLQIPCRFVEAFSNRQFPVGGGQTTLDWKVTNAIQVSIAPSIGAVATTGSRDGKPMQSVTYTLTAN